MPPEPDPIVTYHQTFALEADPEALQAAAAAIRGLALRAHAADQTVDGAADEIESEEAWRGETAGNYQDHRRRLTGDLASLGYGSGRAADALDEIADLLIWYQAALDSEQAALAGIPSTRSEGGGYGPHEPAGPVVTYHPRTEDETTAVSDAMLRASELKSELNEHLAEKETALRREVDGYARPPGAGDAPGVAMLARTWRPRSLRHLNLNIGEGKPTDAGDMDEFAEIINREGADVVTIQEVFDEDIGELEEHLDGEWEVYFANADNKFRGPSPENWSEDFGNAVLVRQGAGIESRPVEEDNRVKLDAEGDSIPGRVADPTTREGERYVPGDVDHDEVTTASVEREDVPRDPYRQDGEGRAAAVAEITVNR